MSSPLDDDLRFLDTRSLLPTALTRALCQACTSMALTRNASVGIAPVYTANTVDRNLAGDERRRTRSRACKVTSRSVMGAQRHFVTAPTNLAFHSPPGK
ncbi:hypothetical protein BCR44DRAFT_1436695 [Catenaria anguillulae PL171]|uniref:Uncharacterized protein n=1 Tax=Catenaria anguillulae PL171 TaxID=765915 RepID=A0A1Y2HJY7_9FUNG|nr:hypothetical protein BCR44DRAFT_1436695 [Catenaria anguillulae PL171]